MISNDGWDCEETFPMQKTELQDIPTPIAEEAYREYAARYGTSQSLDRLGERGGFGWAELAQLLFRRCRRLESRLNESTDK